MSLRSCGKVIRSERSDVMITTRGLSGYSGRTFVCVKDLRDLKCEKSIFFINAGDAHVGQSLRVFFIYSGKVRFTLSQK